LKIFTNTLKYEIYILSHVSNLQVNVGYYIVLYCMIFKNYIKVTLTFLILFDK